MSTIASTWIDGVWVEVPNDTLQARRLGWRASYPTFGQLHFEKDEKKVIDWVKANFAPNTYKVLINWNLFESDWDYRVYFYHKRDADWFTLRWS